MSFCWPYFYRLSASCVATALLLTPFFAETSRAANRNWQNSGTDWNTGTNWSGNSVPVAGDTATFGIVKGTNPNLSASDTISILNFSTAASSGYDITSSNTGIKLTLTSTGTGAAGAINAANTTGTNTIDAPLILGAAAASTQTFTQASGGTLIVNGVISSTNTLTLNLAGAGTVQFSGANTYAGATTVSAGVLNIRNNTALGTTANGTSVTSGAALELQGTIAVGAEALALNGTGISSGGALRNISGNNSYAGLITLGSATRINSDSGTLTLDVASGNAITGTQNLTFGGAGNVTVNDAIATGTGTVTKDGAGTLTFAGANTYTGATTISAGTLQIGNGGTSGSLGSGAVTDNAALSFNRSDNVSVANTISGSGTLRQIGSGTITLTSANTYTGATTVSSGKLAAGATNALGSTSSVTVSSGGTLLLSGVGGNNRINNSAAINLNGGATFNTGGLTEGVVPTGPTGSGGSAGMGALTLAATSPASHIVIDFTAPGSALAFSSLVGAAGQYVDIFNWTGNLGFDDGNANNDRLLSASDPGLSQTDLANFNFYSDGGSTLITAGGTEFVYGNMFEIVAVPEPGTWFAAVLTLAAIGFSQRKRLRAYASSTAKKHS
jgi:fibronectin-binding autotransporter adhesin